ncbi:MAG: sodium-translocating pyrophosphatase [bacterium]|nr:sodium-translocating pyrophosphatase [bacterium]
MAHLEILTGIIALASLGYVVYLIRWIWQQDLGEDKMRSIADAIREGANAFLNRQYRTIGYLALVLTVLLYAAYAVSGNSMLGIQIASSFLFGAICSAVAGFIGMYISVRTNIRVAAVAKQGMGKSLVTALRGGAVSGITIVAMSLLGISILYFIYDTLLHFPIDKIPSLIVGYGFGASFVALFAQLGGGIYTKAADVGADLVGKVEVGIPEDDPRNPAVVADLVGDNVGDCAGRGADLFESTAAENIGAMILGAAVYAALKKANPDLPATAFIGWIMFPLVVRAIGLIATIIGVSFVKSKETDHPMSALNRGYFITSILAAIGFYFTTMWLLNNIWFFYCGLVGILMSIAFVFITQYYTEARYRPVREIAEASKTGHATNIIAGMAVAFECTAIPIITIAVSLWLSYMFGVWSGLENGGLFGTAVATMGMLATCGYILAMDTFGPIVDNAGGIVEMSGAPEEIRKNTDKLDATGNTTKALTKGYAVGSAALAAFLLFSAYLTDVSMLRIEKGMPALLSVDIAKIEVFIGAMFGAMLVFLFSAYAIKAVGKTAQYIITEVRRQFQADSGIMAGTSKPDYAKCVDITTKGALKNMILPGLIAVAGPVLIGIILRAEAVASMLMIGTIVGVIMGLVLNNGGGAWDNAKKYIEAGHLGGKGSDAHKAAVTGDTVGDPFKDTAGPSLHVLVKLLSTLTLALAALFV